MNLKIRFIVATMLMTLLPLGLAAQEELSFRRGNCMPEVNDNGNDNGNGPRRAARRLQPMTGWDATKTYKQLVVLIEFEDLSFKDGHDVAFYDKFFNNFDVSAYEGKTRYGSGSVADYFRTQSDGLFNLSFDILGPYKVNAEARTNPTKVCMYEGGNAVPGKHLRSEVIQNCNTKPVFDISSEDSLAYSLEEGKTYTFNISQADWYLEGFIFATEEGKGYYCVQAEDQTVGKGKSVTSVDGIDFTFDNNNWTVGGTANEHVLNDTILSGMYAHATNVAGESVYGGKVIFKATKAGTLTIILGGSEVNWPSSHKKEEIREAIQKMVSEQSNRDFKQYDWNGDGVIEQVVCICAGASGNMAGNTGYLHPNTSSFGSVTTHDGLIISSYNSSAELWTMSSGTNCGIGTICHEFSHSLGLPDIYPVSNEWTFSVVDEWDLMDGGNFTNYGWCPPNYSPLEKMLMGWLQPEELTEAFSATGMPSAADSRLVYQVKHTDNEYLLIENRQWKDWDFGLPGKGVVIWHVNYDNDAWHNNRVNSTANKPRYSLVAADNMTYDNWVAWLDDHGIKTNYQQSLRLHNYHLSDAPYPFISSAEEGEANNELTDTSVPAAKMYTTNSEGNNLLGKPITNIAINEEGLAYFDFMGGTTGIRNVNVNDNDNLNFNDNDHEAQRSTFYDLSGHRVSAPVKNGLYIVREKDGTVRKQIWQHGR